MIFDLDTFFDFLNIFQLSKHILNFFNIFFNTLLDRDYNS